MYFANDFWALIAFITIEMIVMIICYNIIDKGIPWIFQQFLYYVVFPIFVSIEDIRIHEAGHMLAFLKTCTNLKPRSFVRQAKRITEMNQSRLHGDVHINTNEWNYRNKILLMGGCAAEMKSHNMTMNRFQYSIYFWLKGCGSDFCKLRFCHHMSKQQVIMSINNMIASFSEKDMQFIARVSDEIKNKEAKKSGRWKKRSLNQEELFNLAQEYYYMKWDWLKE